MAIAWLWSRCRKRRRLPARTISLGALVGALAAASLCCGKREDGKRMNTSPSAGIVFTKELEGRVHAPPFFWRNFAPDAAWVVGYLAIEENSTGRGAITAVRILDRSGKPIASFALNGAQVAAGHQIAVGDLNRDGRDELIVLDLAGRVHACGADGKPLPGFPTPPSEMRVLTGPPLIRDINGDGREEIVLLGADQPLTGSKSMLAAFDAAGLPLKGYPIGIEPPAISPPVTLRLAPSGPCATAFCSKDGSIWLCDAAGRMARIGSVPAEHSARLRLAAADVDGDGAEELLFVHGDAAIQCASASGKPCAGWPLSLRDLVLTALVSGTTEEGAPLICAYDGRIQQLVFWNRAEKLLWPSPLPAGPAKIPVQMAAVEPAGGQGSLVVAELCTPEGEADVDPAFDREASPETRAELERFSAALRKSYGQSAPLTPVQEGEIARDLREYKRDLLVDQLGEKRAAELLSVGSGTEIWVFDSKMKPLEGMPITFQSQYPFLDRMERVAAVPALLSDPSSGQLLMLVGMNGRAADPGRIHLCRLK